MSGLHLQRCWNHADREAAARCPQCGRFYCRECVAEHDRRFLCTACLTVLTVRAAAPPRDWTWVWVPVQCGTGLVLAWFCFYLLGRLLADLPDDFHEGTFWKQVVDSAGKGGV